jgi:hypothetical protein
MSVTDQYVENNVIYRLLENGNADAAGTLLTSQFTLVEIIDCMNRVQQQFLLDTGAIVTRVTIAGNVGKPKYDMPTDSIRPRRVTWNDTSDNLTRILTQTDTWDLDTGGYNNVTGAVTWPADRDIPIAWWETTLPQQKLALALTPLNDGTIGLLYVALAQTLTGTGTTFTVPDDFTPYILWGTLNELLSSDGPAYDPARAQYCEQRYQEGVELCRLILGG